MTLSPDQKGIFFGLFRALTPGHASTVIASLSEPGSLVGTSIDSENYAFLLKLCEWGPAREVPLELEREGGDRAGPEPSLERGRGVKSKTGDDLLYAFPAASSG